MPGSSPAPEIELTANGNRASSDGEPISIGRGKDADLKVASELISRIHAIVEYRDGWRLRDNDSLNGCFRGGEAVEVQSLTDGDELWLGDPDEGVKIEVRITSAAPIPDDEAQVAPPTEPPPPPAATPPPPPPPPPPAPAPGARDRLDTTAMPDAKGFTIGRAADNDVVIPDRLLSRHHASLQWRRGQLVLEDLDSRNGTFVGGQRIRTRVLTAGDVVTFGNSDYLFTGTEFTRDTPPAQTAGQLEVNGVGLTIAGGRRLLEDVTFTARPGTLTAVIGPSGAGKSTLSRIVAGTNRATDGQVIFAGRDLHRNYDALRSRIGMVPQDDVVHRQLTVRQALTYAAQLRLPADTSREELAGVVDSVTRELGLTEHSGTRVDRLSGGQRKRASVAMELLTEPSLLLLDEPTSGLDPALDRQVMTTLRSLADAGRIVLVVTHSLAYLDLCDQVLLLAPGGKPAYCGAPSGVEAAFRTGDWAEIFARVAEHPDDAYRTYLARRSRPTPAASAPEPEPVTVKPPTLTTRMRQWWTLCRRQTRIMMADRAYLAFLAALPIALGVLSLVVPGSAGFGKADVDAPAEGGQLLVLLILGACFMGASLSVRDLVAERPIYQRERAVGLLPGAYLAAKTTVFGVASWVQSAILVGIVLAGKPGPGHGAVLSSGSIELYLDIAITAWCSAILGMVISALVKSSEQSMPLLVVVIMAELVMCGGMIPVTGRAVLAEISLIFPARWGYAAGASTVDLRHIAIGAEKDALWNHTPGQWWLAIAMLVALAVVLEAITWWRVRLRKGR